MTLPDWWDADVKTTPNGLPLLREGASEDGHEARRKADRYRGKLLADISEGRKTIWDVIREVDRTRDRYHLRLSLRKMLLASGQSVARTNHILSRLRELHGDGPGKIDIAWLIDQKAGTSRLALLADVLAPADQLPWEGFPYSEPPFDIEAVSSSWGLSVRGWL